MTGKHGKPTDPLEPYRRVRKHVPPPGGAFGDRRERARAKASRGEAEEGPAPFRDRIEAGGELAEALRGLVREPATVLGIPRGGVVVAAEVARALGLPLDVVVPRKVRAPRNRELGLGAIAPGVRFIDEGLVRVLGVSEAYLEEEIARQEEEIARRTARLRGDRPPVELAGRTAIVVDDGIATGGTAIAAIRWARLHGAARVVLAAPVAPADVRVTLGGEGAELVILATPEPFRAVGQWYEEFPQISDAEAARLLEEAAS